MREFLRQVCMRHARHLGSWHVARLDSARWHTCLNCGPARLQDVAFLWEAAEQAPDPAPSVAILIADGGPGEAHLLLQPIL